MLNDNKTKVVLNWSSGKDAALTYQLLSQDEWYDVTHLLTTINDEHDRVVMHGVRESLLNAQAERMGKDLVKVKLPAAPTDEVYKKAMERTLLNLSEQGITTAAYGDISLEDLKAYREEQLSKVDFMAIFTLCKRNTAEVVQIVESTGIEAMIVCVNEKFLGKEFLGRKINEELLHDIPPNVDPCGENGEFHTFVINAPFFSSPIPVQQGEIIYKAYTPAADDTDKWNTGFYFMDLLPAT